LNKWILSDIEVIERNFFRRKFKVTRKKRAINRHFRTMDTRIKRRRLNPKEESESEDEHFETIQDTQGDYEESSLSEDDEDEDGEEEEEDDTEEDDEEQDIIQQGTITKTKG
jgi:hypothetical protein